MNNPASHLRFDVTSGDWVVFAPARIDRPHAVPESVRRMDGAATCPFCPGREHETPPELLRISGSESGSWSVRVVPNKFPALVRSEQSGSSGDAHGSYFERTAGGYGAHEVVIESPEHSCALAQQPPEQVERTLAAIQHRVSALEEDERIEAVVAFKNHGTAAGTSLEHPHWQILATPVVPPRLAVKQKIASEHFGRSSKCLYREVLAHELAAAQRVLEADEHHVAYVPFASRFPYAVRIVPREPLATFAGAAPETLASLAKMLRSVLGALDRHLGDPAFNLTIESAPVAFRDSSSFSWHIDVLPRLARLAGFELASGMSINPVLPETAARELYQALARQGNGRP